MTNLPNLVDTYNNVVMNRNPFENFTGYGYTADQYNDYMHLFHGMVPVMNDYLKLSMQIQIVLAENAPKYAAMYRAQVEMGTLVALSEMHYTDTNGRTGSDTYRKNGTETNTRNGEIADSGTDSSKQRVKVTDRAVTYDNNTMRDISQTETEPVGNGSEFTHGKKTTYTNLTDVTSFNQRNDVQEYNSTFTRTVDGYKSSPADIMRKYTDFARYNNVFIAVIDDVLQAISCIVYIPVMPENFETEE